MPKEKEKKVKKNPLLDAEEDTSKEEETAEDTADEAEEEAEESVEEKPVKKTAKVPVKAPVNIGEELKSDMTNVKNIIDAEPKVHFMVPLAEGEKAGTTHDVFINGYKYSVKKGVMVQIPESVFNLLADHYKITSEAGQAYRVDLDAGKQTAL